MNHGASAVADPSAATKLEDTQTRRTCLKPISHPFLFNQVHGTPAEFMGGPAAIKPEIP